MQVEVARREMAKQTRRGVGNVVTYLITWVALGMLGVISQTRSFQALAYLLVAIFIWPLSLLVYSVYSVFNGGQRLKANPLAPLIYLVGATQLLTLPLVVGIYLAMPDILPWYFGVLVGAQLLTGTWIYSSPAYLFGSLGVVEVATLAGWLAPTAVYVAAPLLVSVVLIVTMFFLLAERPTD